MNNKGEISVVGFIITAFILLMVALAIYTSGIAPNVGTLSTSVSNNNVSMTGMAGGVNFTVPGMQWIGGTVLVTNNSAAGVTIPATNYTIDNNVLLSDGTMGSVVRIKHDALATTLMNLSYSEGHRVGYVEDGGTRSIVGAMVILIALAVVFMALTPQIKELADKF